MYSKLLDEFDGLPVVAFDSADSWKGPKVAYRIRAEYDDEVSNADRLAALTAQPGVEQVRALIIGAWNEAFEGGGSEEMVQLLVRAAPALPGLKALFFGEMTFEECEISWIKQSNLSPLLAAFPSLETLRIRGGAGLSFRALTHPSLRKLAIETGGLSRSTLRELFLCEFPALEELELLLGEQDYGFDGGVEDLQPLLSGSRFPRLQRLGLMNSAIADEIAAVVVNAPLTARLNSLDLSMGNLTDEGAHALRGLAAYPNLKSLNVSHHYASEEAIAGLMKSLKCDVFAADPQNPEDEWRPIVHAE